MKKDPLLLAEKTNGLYKLITNPTFYGGLQKALGATTARHRIVEEWFALTPSSRVLDLGCGPAPLLPLLQFSHYHGVDLNARHIEYARASYGSESVTFDCGSAQEIVPSLEGPFDRVICSGFLHHLSDKDVLDLIALLSTKLTPDGFIASVEPVFLPRQRLIAKTLKNIDSGQHIRQANAWESLLFPFLLEHRITHDLLRLPYDHIWLKLGQTNPNGYST